MICMAKRGKIFALSTVAVGVVVLVAAGIAAKERIREEWYLWKLEWGNPDEQVASMEKLGEMRSVRAVKPLVAKLKQKEVAASAQESLLEILAKSDSPDAIHMLSRDLEQAPFDFRLRLVDDLEHLLRGFLTESTKVARSAIEDLLVTLLDDVEEPQVNGLVGHLNPRICDLAAAALSKNWTAMCRFPLTGSLRAQDLAIAEIKNTWRGEKGIDPVALPRRPKLWSISEDAVASHLQTFEGAGSAAEAESAVRGLEQLGLGVLPSVRRNLESLAKDHPGREALEVLALRLESTVGEVDFYPETPEAARELEALLRQSEGKPIVPEKLVAVFAHFVRDPISAVGGLELTVSRTDPAAPITITARLIKEKVKWRVREGAAWAPGLSFSSGKGDGVGGGAFLGPEEAKADAAYHELSKALEEHLAVSQGQWLVVKMSVVAIERTR